MENENKDKREQVKDLEIKVTSIEAEEGFEDGVEIIKRVVINAINEVTDEELRITHKPKMKEEQFRNGILHTKTVLATPNKINQIIVDMGNAIAKKGSVFVKCNYTVWQQWSDEVRGHKAPIRYVQYSSQMDSWEIIDKPKQVTESYDQWLAKLETKTQYPVESFINEKFLKVAEQKGDLFEIKSGMYQRLE